MTGTTVLRRLVAGTAAALALTPLVVAAPSGAQAPAQWNIAMVGGPAGGGDVTIAVIDSGVQADHYAFEGPTGSRVLPGIDLVDGGRPDDANGHGTHVAGIAAGGSILCRDVATTIGVAPEAAILPVRVLDHAGKGDMADVVAGIEYAVAQGADVINLSLGETPSLLGLGGNPGPFLDALSAAWDAGSIPVLAAGNSDGALHELLFPQGYGNVDAVVVTAVDATNTRPAYAVSASTARRGIAAPGGTTSTPIVSSLEHQQCGDRSGTSMAAPHVSGALAVLRSRGLGPVEAVERLLATARSSGAGTGAGLVDLAAALDGLPTPNASTTTTTVGTTTTGSSTTTETTVAESTTTSTVPVETVDETEDEDQDLPAPELAEEPPDDRVDVDAQEAVDLTIVGETEQIPGGVAVVAALSVTLVWMGWLGALRRQFL